VVLIVCCPEPPCLSDGIGNAGAVLVARALERNTTLKRFQLEGSRYEKSSFCRG